MKSDIEKLFNSIIKLLVLHQHPSCLKSPTKYLSKEGHKSYFISTILLRKLVKSYIPDFLQLTFEKQITLANMLYETEMEESIIFANALLGKNHSIYSEDQIKQILKLVSKLISWSTTDDFCMLLSQKFFLKYPQLLIPILRKWNKSSRMWVRRSSVVTLTRKVGVTGIYTELILELCENLINDDNDLIRKAIGWCLKDALKGDKKKIITFVKFLRRNGISSTITLYAIRDIKGNLRNEILACKPDNIKSKGRN